MADVGFRDFSSSSAARGGREEPTVAPLPSVPVTNGSAAEPVPLTGAALLGGGEAPGELPGLAPILPSLVQLSAHRRTATPLVVGLLGCPGCGKTTALAQVVAATRDLAAAAGKAGRTPFLSRIHVQDVDAATLDGPDPAGALAATLHNGLRRPYPELARALAQTARDPHLALRDAGDKLDDARRRLDLERRALEDIGSRRTRLTETVLFEASGSRLDAYARANRGGIERRLTAFGVGGEPMRSYKELVQYAAGPGGRAGLTFRAFWAYRGQLKLVVLAILLVAAGIGLGFALADQDVWLERLRSGPQAGTAVANWFAAHIGLLESARTAAFVLAALALVANAWRGLAFLAPVFKGVRLLAGDLETRRRDLDGAFAHATKRADGLERDVERLARENSEAERRVEQAGGGPAGDAPALASIPGAPARDAFAALAAAFGGEAGRGVPAPQRVVIALDGLEALAPERARAVLDALHRMACPGVLALVALDPGRVDPEGTRGADFARWIGVPVRLDVAPDAAGAAEALAARVLGRAPLPVRLAPDAGSSALDEPLDAGEADLLLAMTPLAGPTPRAARRFLDAYALARLRRGPPRGALAFMLAVAGGADPAARAVLAEALARSDPAEPFALPPAADKRLHSAWAVATQGEAPFTGAQAVAAAREAARFAFQA